jgi:hypothetical protein
MLTHKDKHDIRPRALHTRIPHHLPSPHRANVSPLHVPQITHVLTQTVTTATAVTPTSLNQMLLPQQSHPSHRTRCGCHWRHTHLNQRDVVATAVTPISLNQLWLPLEVHPPQSTRCCCHSSHTHLTEPVAVAIGGRTHLNQPVGGPVTQRILTSLGRRTKMSSS